MAIPLKDLGRLAVDPRDHRVLARLARARGISQQDLIREVLSGYVRKQVHDAKVVLGQDSDNSSETETDVSVTEDDGSRRSARR